MQTDERVLYIDLTTYFLTLEVKLSFPCNLLAVAPLVHIEAIL